MDIRYEWDIATCCANFAGDVFEVCSINFCLCGDADNLAASLCECEDFCDAGGCIAGVRGDHRLHPDGIFPADTDVPDHYFPRNAA